MSVCVLGTHAGCHGGHGNLPPKGFRANRLGMACTGPWAVRYQAAVGCGDHMTGVGVRESFSLTSVLLAALVVLTGILGGLGAVLFRGLIDLARRLIYFQAGDFTAIVPLVPGWRVVIGPAIGGVIVALVVYLWAREARGSGVPEVIDAVARQGSVMQSRTIVAKALASAFCIGSGGSAGREGPVIQIGGAIGSVLGQRFNLSSEELRVLVGCGAAAGIGATFNAPIAGAIFALEIILVDLSLSTVAPVMLASVLGTVVSRAILGNYPLFQVPSYPWYFAELPSYLILGAGAGLVAVSFTLSVHKMEELWNSVPVPGYCTAAVGGLIVGGLGLYVPQIMGLGYPSIERILRGQELGSLILLMLPLKILATSITLGSGGSGGILSPSFFFGAAFGSLFGMGMNAAFPELAAPQGAYALVGMCAVVSGTTLAPMQAVVMVLEMTKEYQLILPLTLCCAVSTFVAYQIKRQSVYTLKLARRGVDIEASRRRTG